MLTKRTLILTVNVANMTAAELESLQAALIAQLEDTNAGDASVEIRED